MSDQAKINHITHCFLYQFEYTARTMKNEQIFEHIAVTPEPKSQVKIVGEIPWELAEKQRAKAVAHLGKDVRIDGFRPGMIPEAMLVSRLGESVLLEEMAFRSVIALYPDILRSKNIDAIGSPRLTLTKVAKANPVGFTVLQTVIPVVTLPDYKGIAKGINTKKDAVLVTEADVEKQIADILHRKAAWERMQKLQALEAEGKTEEAKTFSESEAEKLELTDDVVKTLGAPDQFKDVADFRAKITEHLEIEKRNELTAKHKAAITDSIVEKAQIDVPELLIDHEINQMSAQMEEDLKRANLKMDDYLTHIKKTPAELRIEWLPMAEKRAKLQLVLNEIAKKESITPKPEELEGEVRALLNQFKDADESRVRTYVDSVLTNEAVMQMLEQC